MPGPTKAICVLGRFITNDWYFVLTGIVIVVAFVRRYNLDRYGPDGAEGTIAIAADAVTASGAGADNIWVSNCKTSNHNP